MIIKKPFRLQHLLIVILTLLFLSLMLRLSIKTINADERTGHALSITPTVMATSTPLSPVFSATMKIIPSHKELAIGETLVVTGSIDVSEGCSFPIYELKLKQDGDNEPIFTYVSPPTATIGPPVSNPFSYTLTAVTTGTVMFRAQAYGERYCNDFWNWTYVNGTSDSVSVVDNSNESASLITLSKLKVGDPSRGLFWLLGLVVSGLAMKLYFRRRI